MFLTHQNQIFVPLGHVYFVYNVKAMNPDQFNPLPDDKILDKSNLKQSADDNFTFDEKNKVL